ncbi:MerR family transcriptional regulator [Geodermatophilus sp. SYSU D00705]
MTTTPTLLMAAEAAAYAGVKPATLRVWRHRYGLTPRWSRSGHALYDMAELAALMARRAARTPSAAGGPPSLLDVLDAA